MKTFIYNITSLVYENDTDKTVAKAFLVLEDGEERCDKGEVTGTFPGVATLETIHNWLRSTAPKGYRVEISVDDGVTEIE